jgi:hypothetical protein
MAGLVVLVAFGGHLTSHGDKDALKTLVNFALH